MTRKFPPYPPSPHPPSPFPKTELVQQMILCLFPRFSVVIPLVKLRPSAELRPNPLSSASPPPQFCSLYSFFLGASVPTRKYVAFLSSFFFVTPVSQVFTRDAYPEPFFFFPPSSSFLCPSFATPSGSPIVVTL